MPLVADRIKLPLIALLASTAIRAFRVTMRLRRVNAGALDRARAGVSGPCILAFWHGRLLMMRYAYPGRRITVLISRHRDGEIIARTLGFFGVHSTRGSTTQGGMAGLREVVRRLREGWDAAFTPDGPRGPRHVVQPGVIEAARLSGAPIVPVSFACRSGWFLRSWDRFLIPRPFTKGVVLYGEPLRVPSGARGESLEAYRRKLEREMIELEERSDRLARGGGAGG